MRTSSRAAQLAAATLMLGLFGCAKNTAPAASAAPVIVVGEAAKPADPKDKPKADAAKDARAARKAALEEAAEFGMLGVLGGTEGAPLDIGALLQGGGAAGGVVGGVVGGFGGLGGGGVGLGGGGLTLKGEGMGLGGLGTIGTLGGSGAGYGSGYNRPKAKIEQATVTGPLVPEIVQRVLADHRNDIQDCYVLEASRGGRPHGRITLAFTIDPKGHVREVRSPESTLSAQDLNACIADVIGTFDFPPPAEGGEVTVLVPVTF